MLREKQPAVVLEVTGDLDVRIIGPENNGQGDLWLGRAYEEFCQAPAQADEIIARYVRNVLSDLSNAPLALDRLVPAIKPYDWVSKQRSLLGSDTPGSFDPWVEPYNAELSVVYAEYSEGLRFPHRSDFGPLGLDSKALRERALANLRRIIQLKIVGDDGTYIIGAGGTVDAAVILLEEVMSDPRLQLAGEPLAGVSDRDSAWVADGANPEAVFRVATGVFHHYRNDRYPISPSLYRRANGCWEPLDPDPVDETHPLPNLDVIDVLAKKSTGTDIGVVVARPLGADARSIFRLCRKLDAHLQEVNSRDYQEEFGPTTPQTTSISVHLHRRSDPQVERILLAAAGWARRRHVSLRVDKIKPVAVT